MRYRPLRPTRELPREPGMLSVLARGAIVAGVIGYFLVFWQGCEVPTWPAPRSQR